ncbi:MAG: hypothetical protein ACMG6S_19575 [Byssovorax sp.]
MPAAERAEPFKKLERILRERGLHEALRFLNSRTPHRFTGVYLFDPPMLRNLHLIDAYDPEQSKGDDALMTETYCSIVGQTRETFSTADTRVDPRLGEHPARDSVLSYCGVLLRDIEGKPRGTLCHFDLLPCDVPINELPLMEAAASIVLETVQLGAVQQL